MTLYPASSSTRGATSVAGSEMLSVNHSEFWRGDRRGRRRVQKYKKCAQENDGDKDDELSTIFPLPGQSKLVLVARDKGRSFAVSRRGQNEYLHDISGVIPAC